MISLNPEINVLICGCLLYRITTESNNRACTVFKYLFLRYKKKLQTIGKVLKFEIKNISNKGRYIDQWLGGGSVAEWLGRRT